VDEGVGSFVLSQSSEVHLTFIWEMVMVGGGAVAGQDPEPKAISRVIGQTRWASLFHPGILQPFTAFLDLCPVQKLSPHRTRQLIFRLFGEMHSVRALPSAVSFCCLHPNLVFGCVARLIL
jgi:hypothetical protein